MHLVNAFLVAETRFRRSRIDYDFQFIFHSLSPRPCQADVVHEIHVGTHVKDEWSQCPRFSHSFLAKSMRKIRVNCLNSSVAFILGLNQREDFAFHFDG